MRANPATRSTPAADGPPAVAVLDIGRRDNVACDYYNKPPSASRRWRWRWAREPQIKSRLSSRVER